jgi:uncharacterized protein
MTTAIIQEYVRQECGREANLFGPSFFDQHLAVVALYAGRLAQILGADVEAVELAAYLHDLSAVRDPATLPHHARASAALARRLLSDGGWPPACVDGVARCIESHSSPVRIDGGSPEEVCVSNADAISQIVRPAYWAYVVFGVRRQGFEEGREWLLHRIESNWESLVEPARGLARGGYERAREFLEAESR